MKHLLPNHMDDETLASLLKDAENLAFSQRFDIFFRSDLAMYVQELAEGIEDHVGVEVDILEILCPYAFNILFEQLNRWHYVKIVAPITLQQILSMDWSVSIEVLPVVFWEDIHMEEVVMNIQRLCIEEPMPELLADIVDTIGHILLAQSAETKAYISHKTLFS